MNSLTAKALWVKRNALFFPEIARKIRYRFTLGKELAQARAVVPVLDSLSISEDEALQQLFPDKSIPVELDSLLADELALAKSRISQASDHLGGAAALSLLFKCAVLLRARSIVETGVAYGWSSLVLLTALRNLGAGTLVSIDFPQFGTSGDSVGIAVGEDLKQHWKLLIGPDRKHLEAALKYFGNQIDLCHYDSDKSLDGRKFAYPRLWHALVPGGLFISDDIGDNSGFLDFARSTGVEPIIVRIEELSASTKYIGILCKGNPQVKQ